MLMAIGIIDLWMNKSEQKRRKSVRMVFDSHFELSRAEKFWTKILNMNKDEQD